MYNLVIVESPTKAKTISKFLGKNYRVKSSMGHIRDLPSKKMGIDIAHNFTPEYIIPDKAQKTAIELIKDAAKAETVILATDEDREGEAIAWHLISVLGLKKKPIQRIVFHEITKTAIEGALKNPRGLDMHLVDAQQARRILDRLVGYELSPFLWKKIYRGLSAGRVQSVAVRLIVDREKEINGFKPEEYWSIEAILNPQEKPDNPFTAKLHKVDDKTIDKLEIKFQKQADEILQNLQNAEYRVADIIKKEVNRNPLPPFKTSTLQQEANNKLGYSAKQTMRLAQQLYEGINIGDEGSVGLITYMRTDSLNLSANAVSQTREYIQKHIGNKYVPANPNIYKTKDKSAQEAHEAIRPTFPEKSPENLKEYLDDKQYKLYNLIWRRMIASQMPPAKIDSTTVDIHAKNYIFRATGSVIKFDGFLKIYETQTKEVILPELKENEILDLIELKPEQHFTQPPPRYTEASLVKDLEEEGIGRPSTYAPTISTIQDRGYVEKREDKRFRPKDIGMLVTDLLVTHFPNIVDLKFTARMEEDLDKIAAGETEWVPIIDNFYQPFHQNLMQKEQELTKKNLTEEGTDQICEKCGSPMVIKMGRFGKFMACSNYPECKNTKPIYKEGEGPEPEATDEKCEKCGSLMVIKHGRYGKFLGCSGYPDCKNIKKIQKSTGVKCPACGEGEIVEKKSKTGKLFYACNRYPKCENAYWGKPTGEQCPECGTLLIAAGKDNVKCSNKECGFKK